MSRMSRGGERERYIKLPEFYPRDTYDDHIYENVYQLEVPHAYRFT